jgi:hypothetical protein
MDESKSVRFQQVKFEQPMMKKNRNKVDRN